MSDREQNGFGELRSLLNGSSSPDSEALWKLVEHCATQDPETYREAWVPYLEGHANLPTGSWHEFDSVEQLADAKRLAPFAAFSLSTEGMIAWIERHEGAFDTLANVLIDPICDSDEEFSEHLDEYFFGSSRWRASSSASMTYLASNWDCYLVAWCPPDARPREEPRVAWIDNEGAMFLISKSFQHFIQQIAHAPSLYENKPGEGLNEEKVQECEIEEVSDGVSEYLAEVEAAFGQLPSYEALLEGLSEQDRIFKAWREQVNDF